MNQRNTPFRSRMNTLDIKTTRQWKDGYPFAYIQNDESSSDDEGNFPGCFARFQRRFSKKKEGNNNNKMKSKKNDKKVEIQRIVVPPVLLLPRIITTPAVHCRSCDSGFDRLTIPKVCPRSYSCSQHSCHSSEKTDPSQQSPQQPQKQQHHPQLYKLSWNPRHDVESSLGYGSKLDCGDSFGSYSDTDSHIYSESIDESWCSGYDFIDERSVRSDFIEPIRSRIK